MKILVFSDSHNRNQYMKKAIDLHRESGIDCIFHLGDGHSDLEELKLDIPIMFVDGNCDEYSYSFLEKKNVIREKSISYKRKIHISQARYWFYKRKVHVLYWVFLKCKVLYTHIS